MAETERQFIERKAHEERKSLERAGARNVPTQEQAERNWQKAAERADREKLDQKKG